MPTSLSTQPISHYHTNPGPIHEYIDLMPALSLTDRTLPSTSTISINTFLWLIYAEIARPALDDKINEEINNEY